MKQLTYRAEIDGLRAFAILLVVAQHSMILPENCFSNLFSFGGMGVDLFFIISGFLITNILLKTKNNSNGLVVFYWRRLLRIFPLYYLVLLLAFVGVPLLANFSPFQNLLAETMSKLKEVNPLPYFFYLSNFEIARVNDFKLGLIDISWSLCVEEHFYLIWPFIVYKFEKRKLFMLGLFVIMSSPFIKWYFLSKGVSQIAIYTLTPFRIEGLALGSLLALGGEKYLLDKTVFKAKHAFYIFIFFILLVYFNISIYADRIANLAFNYSLINFALFALFISVILSTSKLKKIFSNKILVTIGKYSYGIYLFHVPIQKFLSVVLVQKFSAINENLAQIIFYLLVLILSILVAALSFHLFENLFLRQKDRIKLR